ncbi:MAG: hypothetical protein M3487_09905 [Actinomycetota bacterium]|nr:hypothetical protein [Acidimicrobiia bacterium]MDQ3470061.1 hypothetical protein [Actinomycetota bacterium]
MAVTDVGRHGEPTFLAIVMQVDPAVLSVRLTSPAGHVDSMEPVGGALRWPFRHPTVPTRPFLVRRTFSTGIS